MVKRSKSKKKRIKEFNYYSDKLKRVITVKEHNRHYWIESKDRWKRIDPFKYNFRSGGGEENYYDWLKQFDHEDYNIALTHLKKLYVDETNVKKMQELKKEINELTKQFYWRGSPTFLREIKICNKNEKWLKYVCTQQTLELGEIDNTFINLESQKPRIRKLRDEGRLRIDEYRTLRTRNNKMINTLKRYEKELRKKK